MTKKLFRVLVSGLLCAALLFGAVLPSAAETPKETTTYTEKITTADGMELEYTATDYVIGSAEEKALLDGSSGHLSQFGTTYYRVADQKTSFIYRFSGDIGQMAYIVMDLAYEFLVQVSSDGEEWTDVLRFEREGSFREKRAIDLTPYFEFSKRVYVKVSDAVPTSGWGGQVRSLRYVAIEGPDGELPAYKDISKDWDASTGRTVDAGSSVRTKAGTKVTFSKSVRVPANWVCGQLGLSFSWVESGTAPEVWVDGNRVASVTYYGNNLTVPLPQGSNGKTVKVEVVTTATEDNKAGLWDSVRMGYLDMITMIESEWSLDSETRKVQNNYFSVNTDLVKLNALAGNYSSYLYDSRYGLVSFNGMMREAELFYAHDTSRTLAAFAMEEIYSPIVRLDTIEELYKGVKSAMVPGGEYEMFLKTDARPKQVSTSKANRKMLRLETNQDVVEAFADVYVTTAAGSANYPLAKQTVADEQKEDGIIRTFTSDATSAKIDVTWPACMSDKPTTLQISATQANSFSVVFTNFQLLGREDSRFNKITTKNGLVDFAGSGVTEIAPPEEGYLTLSKGESNYSYPTIITWSVKPQKILVKTDTDKTQYTEIAFVYGGGDTPTFSSIPFESIDPDLGWAYQVAENLVKKGIYGANGYDPSYICGVEGLGPGALAGAAYVFKKYNHPLAKEAENLALSVNRSAYQAAKNRGHVPVYLVDRLQGCFFLNLMGYNEFIEAGDYYAKRIMASQLPDGSFNYFDARNVLGLQLMYETLNLGTYRDAINNYRNSVTYNKDHVLYKGQQLKQHLFLMGSAELGYLGHMGDIDAILNVMPMISASINDTGAFDCSDLNPYFLGWSLKGVMSKQYTKDDKKTVIKKGQSVLYDGHGNVEILDYPTAYINNPYFYADASSSSQVTLGDVTEDGNIDAADALKVLQHAVKLVTLEGDRATAADVNRDDSIDASDALKILQYAVKLIDRF